MIRFGPIDLSDCIYVAKHMRERDRREIGAVMPDFDPVSLAVNVYQLSRAAGVCGLVVSMDKPVAVVSLTKETPRSAQATMFATNEFKRCGNAVTRYMLKRVLPDVVSKGITRIEARCWEGHTVARAWMARMGAVEEVVIAGYGANGENFVQMAWSKCV